MYSLKLHILAQNIWVFKHYHQTLHFADLMCEIGLYICFDSHFFNYEPRYAFVLYVYCLFRFILKTACLYVLLVFHWEFAFSNWLLSHKYLISLAIFIFSHQLVSLSLSLGLKLEITFNINFPVVSTTKRLDQETPPKHRAYLSIFRAYQTFLHRIEIAFYSLVFPLGYNLKIRDLDLFIEAAQVIKCLNLKGI